MVSFKNECQGKIKMEDSQDKIEDKEVYECSKCSAVISKKKLVCPYCGTDLRTIKEEELRKKEMESIAEQRRSKVISSATSDNKLRAFKKKENKIISFFIIISLVINLINYVLFYNEINPFYSIWSFLAFVAGIIGISTLPLIVSAIISIFFILPKKHKHKYIYYFSIIFFILSLFSFHISFSAK